MREQDLANQLHAILTLGQAFAPLRVEKRLPTALSNWEILTLQYLLLMDKLGVSLIASELAVVLHRERTRVSHLLKKLEAGKYLTRQYEIPGRIVLKLTVSGQKIAEEANALDVQDLLRIVGLIGEKISGFCRNFCRRCRVCLRGQFTSR